MLLGCEIAAGGLGQQGGVDALVLVYCRSDELVELVARGPRQGVLHLVEEGAGVVGLVVRQQAVDDAGGKRSHAVVAIRAVLEVVVPQGFIVSRFGLAPGVAELVFQFVVHDGGALAVQAGRDVHVSASICAFDRTSHRVHVYPPTSNFACILLCTFRQCR